MRILHITDSHGTVKGPESRKDIYYIAFLKKLYELGFVVKKMNIDLVVHTGDLFHTARISDKFAGQVSEMIKSMNVPFYVVPGNHDIEGYTTDTIDQTKLGLLAKAGVITILDRDNPIRITGKQNGEEYSVAISGQEYYAHIDEGNMKDFEMQQDEADLNILAIHGYITNTPQHPDIKCTMVNDIVTDADIILTGHYHRQFEWNGPDVDVYNPGSMLRVEQTDYNKTHMPAYGILDIHLTDTGAISYDYNFHQFRIAEPSTVVFDYNAKYKAKTASITLDGFKNSIANTMSTVSSTNNVIDIINDICAKNSVDGIVTASAIQEYNNALQNTPDEFEAQQGFIESQSKKKIVKVILNNFQSHEHTEVDLTDGLNIIVGESNNGKTSILRAIMWVVDNQPLGTDFIMAGKDTCSVMVLYDDGTFIERGRTLKDTGYYKVGFIDENGNLNHQMYRGFTNAVPVEVANVHQMPKVNITKDIETHLNVLSQLDGPFLLTESPLVKASAIGRITGTHVIDYAIKESNKTIQNNKKTIKTYISEIEEKKNELSMLPDIDLLEQFSKAYNIVLARAKKISDDILFIGQKQIEISKCEAQISQQEQEYNKLCILKSLSGMVESGYEKMTYIQYLETRREIVDSIDFQIKTNTDVLNNSKVWMSIRPIVESSLEKFQYVLSLFNKYESYEGINSEIEKVSNIAQEQRELCSMYNNIIGYCGILKDFVGNLYLKVQEIESLEKKQDLEFQCVVKFKKTINGLKEKISNVGQEKNQFIIDNGLCPCCGQTITDTHVSKISEFMEAL